MASVLFSPRTEDRSRAATALLVEHRRAIRRAYKAALKARRDISRKPLIEDMDQAVALFERRKPARH
jgi:hypothetical protein